MKTLQQLKPSSEIRLVESEFLCVIKLAGYTGNLALTTLVTVNTQTNVVKVNYRVYSWNDKITKLNKTFTDYSKAYEYYVKVYTKFAHLY